MNWIELKALNLLYREGIVKLNATLKNSPEIHFLINSLGAIEPTHQSLLALPKYRSIYEQAYLNRFIAYENFLSQRRLLKPQTQFEESDIRILMNIQSIKESGVLTELRAQIIQEDVSLRNISLMFFKNEKYLDHRVALVDALKQILEVAQFSNEKDQQYILKLECHHPKVIVLCENLDFLTKPNRPRKHGIELWHVGGKNVGKLEYAQTRGLPVYYCCDWDYDGLFIIFPLVRTRLPAIELLTPNGLPKDITTTGHKSHWIKPVADLATPIKEEQKAIVSKLIETGQWIVEESNDLLLMLGISEG